MAMNISLLLDIWHPHGPTSAHQTSRDMHGGCQCLSHMIFQTPTPLALIASCLHCLPMLSSRAKNSISKMTKADATIRKKSRCLRSEWIGVGGTWLQLMCCAASRRCVLISEDRNRVGGRRAEIGVDFVVRQSRTRTTREGFQVVEQEKDLKTMLREDYVEDKSRFKLRKHTGFVLLIQLEVCTKREQRTFCFGTRKTVVFRMYTKSPTVKTVNGKESETLQVSVVHGHLGVRIFQEGMH